MEYFEEVKHGDDLADLGRKKNLFKMPFRKIKSHFSRSLTSDVLAFCFGIYDEFIYIIISFKNCFNVNDILL